MVFYKILVEKCISKREELDLSREALADRSGIDLNTVAQFEEGSTKIPVEGFLKIMDALKVELSAHSF